MKYDHKKVTQLLDQMESVQRNIEKIKNDFQASLQKNKAA